MLRRGLYLTHSFGLNLKIEDFEIWHQ